MGISVATQMSVRAAKKMEHARYAMAMIAKCALMENV